MFDIYEAITERIISQLEECEKTGKKLPWQKGWSMPKFTTKKIKVKANPDEIAFNGVSGRAYSFLNQMLLLKGGAYFTFKEVQSLGAKVKKDEKGNFVVFYKLEHKEETDPETGEVKTKTIPILRYYYVFYQSQIDGLDESKIKIPYQEVHEAVKTEQTWDNLDECEKLANMYLEREGVGFSLEDGDRAFYRPSTDSITLPKKSQFKNAEEYYATLYHEMAHSTGHEKRLNRDLKNFFGDEGYSKEELVAECASALLCNLLGIESGSTFKNTVAYIQSWIRALKNDKRMIVSASSRAEKAVAYIMDGKVTEGE